jgi:hypothetical protein
MDGRPGRTEPRSAKHQNTYGNKSQAEKTMSPPPPNRNNISNKNVSISTPTTPALRFMLRLNAVILLWLQPMAKASRHYESCRLASHQGSWFPFGARASW